MIDVRFLLPVTIAIHQETAWMVRNGQLPFLPSPGSVLYVGSYNGPHTAASGHALDETVDEIWMRDGFPLVFVVLRGLRLDEKSVGKGYSKDINHWINRYRQYGFRLCQSVPNPTQPNFMQQGN